MSKLFNLKEWLTLADAARHLTIVFGEEVKEADVLRLALDRQLRLSVKFMNPTHARIGKRVPIADAPYKEVLTDDGKSTDKVYLGITLYTNEVESHVIVLGKQDQISGGIYDLPLIGNEELDVENKFQSLTGGPTTKHRYLSGAFVEGRDGLLCQLQISFDENEFQPGSNAMLAQLEARIANDGIGKAEAEKLLNQHQEDRIKFLEERKLMPASYNYYPAGGLPEDSILIVRTEALREFEQSINNTQSNTEKPLGTKERESILKLVIGLAVRGYGYDPKRNRNEAIKDIKKDIDDLGVGVDEDTIRKWLRQGAELMPPPA